MTHLTELFKCNICTNIVEITHEGVGSLICCNEAMKLLEEHYPTKEDAHFAQIEHIDEITKKIYFNHPMTQEHFIEFIEIISLDKKYIKRKHLKPNDKAELIFKCDCKEGFYIRNYCNIHLLNATKDMEAR
ncbi:MAG: desulfoferrodoxin FeS4 iron-binding domain-containing protein [Candidatus Gastranaerophilales bacterium]|nr:desulfoferrodoxin FeS4 iron-binding domain-containing protein [Candidatus Gastranaerophilales bacterium]